MTPAWVRDYIGLPYRVGGRARDGLDCWGLVRLVLGERFGVTLPALDGGYTGCGAADLPDLAGVAERGFSCGRQVPAGAERPGDVVVMRHGRWPCHVGVVVAPGMMLHIEKGADACLESYVGLRWSRKVIGCWRPST